MFPFRFSVLLSCVAVGLSTGCRKPPEPAPPSKDDRAAWFADATEKSGIKFIHDTGATGKYLMPESVGSGVALFDYDNDGRLDIYLIQNGGAQSSSKNALLHQEANGTFRDVSAGSGLDVAGVGMGTAVGDVNNDGQTDVLVTELGGVRLFLNGGSGTFREATAGSGLDNPFWGTSACFFDYDRDGWLDLVVANYVVYDPTRPCVNENGQPEYCGPKAFTPGTISKLFRNLGAEGKRGIFEDVTVRCGMGALPGPALAVVCADFDGDGASDIFIANDGQANRLWMQQRDGTFKDEALQRGVAFNALGQAQGNMGIAFGDIDGDRRFDLFVAHLMEETHVLWSQSARGLFQDRTAVSGMAAPRWHGTAFGTVFGDFDNDGALDTALVNGNVRRNRLDRPDAKTLAACGPFWADYAQRNQLFANDGGGRFRDVSEENDPFCGTARVARGLAAGDFDNDGGLDLLVTNIASPARLYRNVAAARGHWLLARAVDPALGGRDDYGAVITVEAAGRQWTRWCNPASSYLSSNDPRAHFGLGQAAEIDAIEVLWSDGATERFPSSPADRFVILRKGGGKIKTP